MTHWPDLEATLQGRPGWRRVGREYHGPCPVSGAGRDCCFASEGRAGDVALGCRKCGGNGGKLDSESFLAHLAALVGETARHVAAHATNDRAAIATRPRCRGAPGWRLSPLTAHPATPTSWRGGCGRPVNGSQRRCAGCRLNPRGGVAPAGDTVEIVRVVDGRGHGQVAGVWIRASARFCAAYQDQVKTRLPAARLFTP